MAGIYEEPYVAVTPLYAFSSDSDELSIGEMFRLVKYREDLSLPLPADDIFLQHLQIYRPDYLLWQRSLLGKDDLRQVLNPSSFGGDEGLKKLAATLLVLFWCPATNLFRLLRLFKPGRLVAGNTFVVSCETRLEKGLWETAFGHRCSETVVDYELLAAQDGSYCLSSVDVPFLNVFSDAVLPVLESLQKTKHPSALTPLKVALVLYNQDEAQADVAVLNAFTAFEALLTNESNAELSYRLALRVANLLESDDASRLNTFKEMREFYDLRSKIIHGCAAQLSAKLQTRLQQVGSLREVLRRTILSVMALSLDGNSTTDRLDQLLDEIMFDQEKRREVQKLAAKLLHMGGTASGTVH